MVYMIADNNLDYFAMNDINEMEQGIAHADTSNSEVLVFIDRGANGKPSHPYLMKIVPDTTSQIKSEILKVYPEINSANAQTLQQVLSDVDELTPIRYQSKGLVLWSHGNAWLPPEVSLYSDRDKIVDTTSLKKLKSFGLDEDFSDENQHKEMDIVEMAHVLSAYHFDYILFDACFMGTIEVAYELKDICDYIIGSPTEILSAGFPYHHIMPDLLANHFNPTTIARQKHEYYLAQKGILSSSSVSVVKTSQLEELASFYRTQFAKEVSNINISKEETLYHKDSLQQFDRLKAEFLFDLYHFTKKICESNQATALFSNFKSIWDETVIYQAHTPLIFGTLSLENCNGLSAYLPQSYETRKEIEKYYKTSHGMKQAKLKLFLAIISTLCFSCKDEASEPDYYHISVCNGYFETLDSLQLDTICFFDVKPDSCVPPVNFSKGTYPVVAHTASQLRIEATVNIQGANPYLSLKLNQSGDISIE